MRGIALLLCLFHTVALVATSGSVLCISENGHRAYEAVSQGCCETDDACCEAEGGCDEEGGPHLAAAPDCGDCTDILSPVSSGIPRLHDAVASQPIDLTAIDATNCEADRPIPSAIADVRAGPRRDVLRC
ncbi:MAG: hypothetical protein FD180_1260 [Planctomycetota bacterium]|nr:MAG: hypothetical protein FD180_1260 [Planctomycetota bacterium]